MAPALAAEEAAFDRSMIDYGDMRTSQRIVLAILHPVVVIGWAYALLHLGWQRELTWALFTASLGISALRVMTAKKDGSL